MMYICRDNISLQKVQIHKEVKQFEKDICHDSI